MGDSVIPLSPLYVDLDGTFTRTDLLHESFIVAVKANPVNLFRCFFWLLRGRAYLKYRLARCTTISPASLPLNPEFYAFLVEQKQNGREIILATASNEQFAESICKHFEVFSRYLASTEKINLKGTAKLEAIKAESAHFSYAGNSTEDFVLFDQAEECYLVNPTRNAKALAKSKPALQIFDQRRSGLSVWLKQVRVHQWLKNFLIFVPLFVTGRYSNFEFLSLSVTGFFSFSLLASATYILNDLFDLEADRNHPRKRNRPLACGEISIVSAVMLTGLLFAVSLVLAVLVGKLFVYALFVYLVVTLLYSLKIKEYIGMDVITLASLFTIRIIAGAAILGVPVSFWLLSFSMFIFLSLALVKRCAELKALEMNERTKAAGRDYLTSDYIVLTSIGAASSMLSILMYCFYMNSSVLTNQYQEPTWLWLNVPALSYWLIRMWIKTNRGEMHDDPIVFSLKDNGSRVSIGFILSMTILAQIL